MSVLNSVVQQTDDINFSRMQYLNGVKLNCLNWTVARRSILLVDSGVWCIQWRCQCFVFTAVLAVLKFTTVHSNAALNQICICWRSYVCICSALMVFLPLIMVKTNRSQNSYEEFRSYSSYIEYTEFKVHKILSSCNCTNISERYFYTTKLSWVDFPDFRAT